MRSLFAAYHPTIKALTPLWVVEDCRRSAIRRLERDDPCWRGVQFRLERLYDYSPSHGCLPKCHIVWEKAPAA